MAVTTRIGRSSKRRSSDLAAASRSAHDLMRRAWQSCCTTGCSKYNWVGFYMLEPGALPPVLVLGAFEGAMTPHTRIPLNQGICGAAASSWANSGSGRCQ